MLFGNATAAAEIYTLSLHDALPISAQVSSGARDVHAGNTHSCARMEDRSVTCWGFGATGALRSEEHTSELQSRRELVCRLLLEKKKQHLRWSRRTTTAPQAPPTPPH